jgi:hypothetical protein
MIEQQGVREREVFTPDRALSARNGCAVGSAGKSGGRVPGLRERDPSSGAQLRIEMIDSKLGRQVGIEL